MDFSIMPECFADTLMIETFVPPLIRYNHKHSCSQVENEKMRGKLKDRFAVGIIDKDKHCIKYLNEFVQKDKVDGSLILWRHKAENKHHYIIQIQPALEKWILNICEEENINMQGIPTNLDELKQLTKKQSSLESKLLKNLFALMNERNENISVRKLKGWIKLLKEKNYQVDINELKNA